MDSVHYGKPGATADYCGNKVVGVPDWMCVGRGGLCPGALSGVRARFICAGDQQLLRR